MSAPALTVVIPCFNLGQFLPAAVGSVLEMGRPDVEILVVDDGSTEAATIEALARVERQGISVLRQQNGGLAAARNTGIRAARSRIVVPLDADNRLRAGCVEHALRVFQELPRVGVVYGDAEYIGERRGRWVVGPFDPYRLLTWNFIDACAAFRKEVWEGNGGFDARMPVMGLEDWDFWLGAYFNGWEFSYVPEIFFEYRVREGSMISSTFDHSLPVIEYVSRKHGPLYRNVCLQLVEQRRALLQECGSVRGLLRLLTREIGRRLRPAYFRARRASSRTAAESSLTLAAPPRR